MKRKLKIRKLFEWLIRDEISVKKRFINVTLASVIMVLIPCIIFTWFFYKNTFSLLLPIAGILVVASGLWIANNTQKFQNWAIVITFIISVIILPVCYMWDGGKDSSDDLWFMAGLILTFILLEGKIMWIMAGLDSLAIIASIVLERTHPELINHLSDENEQSLEIVISMIMIGIVLGTIFSFQSYLYEKQARVLMEKENHLKEALDALEKANKAKSDFLASMSHEIRTPINAVLGMNEMILRESTENSTLEYAANVDNAANALLYIVNDILDFTKIDSGKMDIVSLDYEMASLLKDCYNMVARKAKEKNLEFTILNNPSIPSVLKGDEIRVRQVVTNILTNAVKYTHAGSVTMKVDYEMTGEDSMNLLISVIDTGIGIKDENKEYLFEKFERYESIENHEIEGTGLGLAITKNLLELMGGSISFESKYGLGSTFSVSIPQMVVDATFAGNLSDKLELIEISKEKYCESFKAPKARILAVDDVKINNDVIISLLKQTEIKIDCAYSGRECLNCLRNNTYDLILMDHMMPEMDGIETLKRIRNLTDSPNKDIPVIILTANALIGAKEEYLRIGFNDYLSKPVESSQLEQMLAKYLPSRLVQSTVVVKELTLEEKLPFLNVKYGVHCCAGDESLYIKALTEYVDKENRVEALDNSFFNKNWKEYLMLVHSIKNLSLLVGDKDLSEEAKGLEYAIKDDRTYIVEKNHEIFFEHYKTLIENIKEAIK
ncbi:MAG: ATP-binding protein [Lachnospiraceae bacterium]|nr:ATP-binding protein [Lachnospiraceae bacterium]